MRAFLAILCLALVGCATTGTVSIPRVPAWESSSSPQPISAISLRLMTMLRVPGVPVYTSDGAYVKVKHEWLEKTLPWSWHAAKATGFTYVNNSRNCTKFTMMYYVAICSAAATAGIEATPMAARIVVPAANGVGYHALLGVVTDRGLYVLEPQPLAAARLVPLEQYPHKILSVIYGDYNPVQ